MNLEKFNQSIRCLGLNFQNLDIDNSKDYCLFLHEQLTQEGVCNIRFHRAIENIIDNERKLYNLPSKALIKDYLPELKTIETKETPSLLKKIEYKGSTIPTYKRDMVLCFENFSRTAAGQYARENNFLGFFYEDGNYSGGLITYIANILLFQTHILVKQEGLDFAYPNSSIEGFTSKDNENLRKWLNSEQNINEILQGNKLDDYLHRRDDLIIIAKYYKK